MGIQVRLKTNTDLSVALTKITFDEFLALKDMTGKDRAQQLKQYQERLETESCLNTWENVTIATPTKTWSHKKSNDIRRLSIRPSNLIYLLRYSSRISGKCKHFYVSLEEADQRAVQKMIEAQDPSLCKLRDLCDAETKAGGTDRDQIKEACEMHLKAWFTKFRETNNSNLMTTGAATTPGTGKPAPRKKAPKRGQATTTATGKTLPKRRRLAAPVLQNPVAAPTTQLTALTSAAIPPALAMSPQPPPHKTNSCSDITPPDSGFARRNFTNNPACSGSISHPHTYSTHTTNV